MAHYHFETNDDGTIRRILRDGESNPASVKLEPLFAIATLYFTTAAANVQQLAREQNPAQRRVFGIQAFIMSLTAVEAFTNIYFKLRSDELGDSRLTARVAQRHGSMTRKIEELLSLAPEGGIEDQATIINRLHELSQLRNTLVHPQWEPASMMLAGEVPVLIQGLVHNFQAAFEDPSFCREALMWCLLLVVRIGKARGNQDLSVFLAQWTGIHGLSEAAIVGELGLGEQP